MAALLRIIALALCLTFGSPSLPRCLNDVCTCIDMYSIVCTKRGLERVPEFSTSDNEWLYSILDLSRNDIFSVPPNAFGDLKVTSIDLSRNAITGISPRGFDGVAEDLQTLLLYNAAIKVLHWAVFQKLTHLMTLDLSRNVMFDIPLGLFDSLTELETLNLSWNRLYRLKTGVFRHLYHLRRLNLVGNVIATIQQDVFQDLRSLTNLKLNSNRLTILNNGMFEGLSKMERLELENNFVSIIESGVFQLPEIEELFLLGNNLTALNGHTFHGAVHLQELYLQDNRISSVSSTTFLTTPFLRVLQLDRNKLQTLGDHCQLQGLLNLKQLHLRDNPLDCHCSMAWIDRLQTDGATISGVCSAPDSRVGELLQELPINITWCEESGHCGANTQHTQPGTAGSNTTSSGADSSKP